MIWVLTIAGFIFGVSFGGGMAGISLALSGYLVGSLLNNNRRLDALSQEVKSLRLSQQRTERQSELTDTQPPQSAASESSKALNTQSSPKKTRSIESSPPKPSRFNKAIDDPATSHTDNATAWREQPHRPANQSRVNNAVKSIFGDNLLKPVFNYFVTGNVVLKVGIVILFVGVGFLFKFAVDNGLLPIELRLAATAIGGIGLLITGWKLQTRNRRYALTLQGAAMGLLYMTVFAAASVYELFPLGVSFAVMFALVAGTSMLSVVQDSRSLAVFAAIGGFAAPVLTSSGAGSHIALFSYYAFLNGGIVAIAWHKSWRLLNWVGFTFTLFVGSLWGVFQYTQSLFISTEGFLILFFLIFVFTSILYAHRQPVQLKGLIDSSLVFGAPTAFFTLQSAMVSHIDYAMAYTSIALGGFYIGVAKILRSRQVEGMQLLTECFFSLGVIFASLSVPYVLEGGWIAATWALEGAAMIWVGIRQDRTRTRLFGALLQLAAGFSFLITLENQNVELIELMVLNSSYIGTLIVAIAGVLSAWLVFSNREKLSELEQSCEIPFLIWGLGWWWLGGVTEILRHTGVADHVSNLLIFFTAGSLLLTYLSSRLKWHLPAVSLLLFPVVVAALSLAQLASGQHPFENFGFLAWAVALSTVFRLLYLMEKIWPPEARKILHPSMLCLSLLIVTWGVTGALSPFDMPTYTNMFWAIIPAFAALAIPRLQGVIPWPFDDHSQLYARFATPPILIYLYCWTVVRFGFVADPAPLPYLPILNPQDLVQLAVIGVLVDWLMQQRRLALAESSAVAESKMTLLPSMTSMAVVRRSSIAVAALMFLWLNSIIAHSVHFYFNVNFTVNALSDSAVFQSALSITWTIVALGGMSVAKRLAYRNLWLISATLLGITVVKLFFVDLGEIGTIARIVSFITVGILMLVIGYLAPIPPMKPAEQDIPEKTVRDA